MWAHSTTGQPQYPRQHENEINLALSEAWAWLQAHGLIVLDMQNGWLVLSWRARAMVSEADFKNFKLANLLPKEILHPKIADPVWRAFMRFSYHVAPFLSYCVERGYRPAVEGLRCHPLADFINARPRDDAQLMWLRGGLQLPRRQQWVGFDCYRTAKIRFGFQSKALPKLCAKSRKRTLWNRMEPHSQTI